VNHSSVGSLAGSLVLLLLVIRILHSQFAEDDSQQQTLSISSSTAKVLPPTTTRDEHSNSILRCNPALNQDPLSVNSTKSCHNYRSSCCPANRWVLKQGVREAELKAATYRYANNSWREQAYRPRNSETHVRCWRFLCTYKAIFLCSFSGVVGTHNIL
jgi:hypothetical protein